MVITYFLHESSPKWPHDLLTCSLQKLILMILIGLIDIDIISDTDWLDAKFIVYII